MNRHFLPLSLGIAGIALVLAAFGTDNGDTAPADDADDGVVLGEVDLAEQAEIWRNQYRRMTPGDEPLVQDVGELPAAWEEFSSAWDSAPAVRDLATWLVPFSAERVGSVTILRDSNGTVLWSGTTDFAKPDSADVTLTGALVDELDWPLYKAAQEEIATRLEAAYPMRGGPYTNGLRFTNAWVATNGDYHFDFAWESNGEVQVFCRAMHTTSWVETVVFTNDENEVVTNDFTHWRNVDGERFRGSPDTWDLLGVLTVTNGGGSFTDTNILEDYDKVRFYTAARLVDSDGDGLTDGEEWLISHSDPDLPDTDCDGIDDWTEYASGTSASASNVWWATTTTNGPWTNYGYQQFPWQSSWPDEPIWKTSLIVTGVKPVSNAIPVGVTLWGMVDDVIKVDSNEVAWTCGATLFSNYDVTASITNLASGRFRIDLFDWPYLPGGGANEVLIGHPDYPFRVEWTWWVPFDVRMEPILGGETCPLDNPCGIVTNESVWFHVEIVPSNVIPATNIVWTSSQQKLDCVPTNRGTRVQVCGVELGEDELQVSVEGAHGHLDIPPFHVKVVAPTIVTAKVGIVTTSNTVWAVQTQQVESIVSSANSILAQAGLTIVVDGDPLPIPDCPGGGYYELDEESQQFVELFQELSGTGFLKLYFVGHIIENTGHDPIGIDTSYGTALAATATGVALAHEVGHRCGLEDIYAEDPDDESCVVEGEIDETRMPSDWGRYRVAGETPLAQASLIPRLLMHGILYPHGTDIPSDEVEGLWRYEPEAELEESLAPVGLADMVDSPQHE